MPRRTQIPYACPCCGYSTPKKSHMHRHLYEVNKPCPQTFADVELTDEVKQRILINRVYKPIQQHTVITTNVTKTHKKKQTINHSLRVSCWHRYVGEDVGVTKCLCCKSNNISQLLFHCGHVVAEADGGKTDIHNLRPICSSCNLSMGTENMRDYAKRCFNISVI